MAGSKKDGRILYESERNFRLLVEGITDYAIYMLDPQGYVANWNAGAARIKGYQEAEIIGRHFSCFYTARRLRGRCTGFGPGDGRVQRMSVRFRNAGQQNSGEAIHQREQGLL